MNISLFAHAGEKHESSTDSFLHLISNDTTLYVPLIILALTISGAAVWFIYKKSVPAGLVTTQLILLISGMMLYSLAPIISTIAIVTGFSLSLFLVLNGLKHGSTE